MKSTVISILFGIMACTLWSPCAGWARVAPWDIEKMPATQAPAFSLPDLSGNTVSSSAFKGKVLLINFWATWCAPCREEMPALDRLYNKMKDKGLSVIGISIDSEKTQVKDFITQTKSKFPILHDPEMTCHDEYKVFAYPTTFLVDKKGVIQKYWIGPQEWESDSFAKSLQEFLK